MLEPMAREYGPQGFDFLFVYTREAHPGEHYGPHRSMEQKLAHAQAFKEHGQVERLILVDDLVGTGHKLYGALPNMTYIIGRSGRVLFRSDWTDPPTLELVLKYLLNVRARRRAGERLVGFYAEFMGYRDVDPVKFHQKYWRWQVRRRSRILPARCSAGRARGRHLVVWRGNVAATGSPWRPRGCYVTRLSV